MDVEEKKKKITEVIRQRGPSLPIHISKETELSILFASAILSEMVSNKILKVSNLKVGGSPLYFISGQEVALENFYNYLPAKEKEAFLLLKKSIVLEDEKLQPAYRVAMRNIKDFAVPMQVNIEEKDRIFWRFHSCQKENAVEIINSLLPKEKKRKPEEKVKKHLERVKAEQRPRTKETEFSKKVYEFLSRENIKIINEEEIKKRSMVLKVLVNSSIGNIEMLAIAKDKMGISENDIRLLVSHGQSKKLPVILLCNGKLSKKAQKEIENFKSYLIVRQLE